jgi:hypothetical protein
MSNPTTITATSVLDAIAEQIAAVLDPRELAGLSEDDLLQVTAAVEQVGRRVDALRVLTAGEIAEASRNELGKCGLAARKGCRNASELIERVTQISGDSARKRIKTGRAVRARLSLAGERLPAEFESVANALKEGTIGLDSAHAIIHGLTTLTHPVGKDVLRAAETELVAAATGATELSPVACTADDIRSQASVWRMFLDQDGSEPTEVQAMRQRFLHLSRERDGLVGVRGALLPDVAAKLQTIIDACLSPKTGPAFLSIEEAMAAGRDADPRSRDQQRHDVFAGIVDTAARALDMPQLGGAAPVVAVAVTQENLETGKGCGFIGGDSDLDGGGAAVRLHRRGAENRVRSGRPDPSVGVPGADLHRPATQGDHPAGRAMLRPRLHHARRLVRDSPCRSGRQWWSDAYR